MKKIITLIALLAISSCRYEETRIDTEFCTNHIEIHSSLKDGIHTAEEKIAVRYEIETDIFGKVKDRQRLDIGEIVQYCTVTRCKENYTEYTSNSELSIYKKLCLPNPNTCEEINFTMDSYGVRKIDGTKNMMETLSDLVEYKTIDSPECSEEEFSCAEGFAINDSNTEEPSCEPETTTCSEEELGAGGASGTKTWNTESDTYGSCMIASCNENYALSENACTLIIPAIYGCMDSRANNFNPAATENDMSCMCSGESLPYNPITGCETIE